MLSYITFNAPTTICCEPPYDDDIPTCPIKYQGIHAYLQTIKYYPTSLDERKIKDAIGIIDDVCGSYILGCFQYHINEYFKNKETRKMSLKKIDDNKELTNFEVCESLLKTRLVTGHFQKNKIPYVMMDVKAIDIQQVITSCIWALYTDELFKDLKVHSIDRILSKTYDVKHELLPSLVQLKNEEIASLKQQLEEKEKTINAISYNVETFERAMSSIKKYKNKIPERDALINKLNKQIEELTKENKEIKEFSRSITLENEELLEKISEIDIENDILESDNKEDNKETFGINPMDKYLFATSEEQIVNRLLTWFPNSSIFPRTDLTSSNKNSYKGIIVITKKIGHPYFYDIKAKSYNLDVPIAYCNKVSFKELCRSISTLQK